MSLITLTTEAALEQYSKRVQEKITYFDHIINEIKEKYDYDPFLRSAALTDLNHDLQRMLNIKKMLSAALSNKNLKIYVNIDEKDFNIIQREEER